ncbi:hypothetical protein CHLNCDRAFT_19872 [Chlorella variabilis]|uniref:O-phosphoseryl-tRNA(Sec) selenium transferase n=1 Tax=Chlorella variabilis TaxID=554065 RepID=E1Z5M8_CHLVA|nr:hypothetical protein CHLNCDRAFT_19872 [Chlorella variabilis]EFN58500.1 hypothetical protein CHLNCDRAFT_19872 [Chlorella variabilis]|eukprot:XP_005850602.1 hypothetical protein CHLNCDRAFT_19872 [Chlorella variabilis]
MDADNCAVACSLVSKTYVQQGSQALAARRRLIKTLLSQRRLPEQGWDDATIEMLLQARRLPCIADKRQLSSRTAPWQAGDGTPFHDAAMMDSNNFLDNVGVGEREARVASELVARRHYRLAHGIGRSGKLDIAAEQPKAAGSSLLAKLTHLLAADALEAAGLREVGQALVVPLATGMAITATLLALRGTRPPAARYVLWPRIDQKTCLKSIQASGFEPVVVPLRLEGDQLALCQQVEQLGADAIACIVTTTSCFAPRAADDVVAVAKLCQQAGVAHIINNAYGPTAAPWSCLQVCSAWRKGRVDAVVQSTDKNFMVPVGGAVIAARAGATQLVERVASLYPGRACMSPLLDLLITLLHWGATGWRRMLQQREQLHSATARLLRQFAEQHGERVLETPGNPISLALSLASFGPAAGPPITFLGSMLFGRCVSGTRVVARGKRAEVGGLAFAGYGAHHDAYPCDYLTVAAALGTLEADIEELLQRLARCFGEFRARQQKAASG